MFCVCVCSSFTAHRPPGSEPPQSAQDKARMDKEYLSLMAELGEAPVPTSGGHSISQGGGPRSSGANNQQPMVSWHNCDLDNLVGEISWTEA